MRLALAVIVCVTVVSIDAVEQERPILRVAVVNTPDVLLNDLLPQFEQEAGVQVRLQIGENAFDIARNGGADLVIAHYGHMGTEAFVTGGFGRWPRMVFSNQAVLVGPSRDPVGIRGMSDVVEAFRLMIRRGGEFIVNNSPTERFLVDVIWEAAGRPPKEGWYLDLGLREQAAIEAAARRGAYTTWGLVPFMRLNTPRSIGLDPLVISDPLLQRAMVAIVVNGTRINGVDESRATMLQRFLTEPRTQARIRQFRHHGLLDQTWWPIGRFNADPVSPQ